MARFAQIVSTGRYLPATVRTNAEIEAILGEPVNQWLIDNVGIRERRLIGPDEVTSDLAVNAARQALERAKLPPEALDLIVVATDTPDYVSPGTASVVQYKLGAANAGTFDVNCACSAWVVGVDIASRYIATDPAYEHVLVVGAYGMTRYVDWQHKKTATLFGDGAGAIVLGAGIGPASSARTSSRTARFTIIWASSSVGRSSRPAARARARRCLRSASGFRRRPTTRAGRRWCAT